MTARQGLIVLGLDDSAASRAALDFALDEGVAHGYAAEIVTAWLWSSAYEGTGTTGSVTEGEPAATDFQIRAMREAHDARSERPVVSRFVVHADAGPALVKRAENR